MSLTHVPNTPSDFFASFVDSSFVGLLNDGPGGSGGIVRRGWISDKSGRRWWWSTKTGGRSVVTKDGRRRGEEIGNTVVGLGNTIDSEIGL